MAVPSTTLSAIPSSRKVTIRRTVFALSRTKLRASIWYFEPAVFIRGDSVAFDERIIQAGAFPVLIAVAFQVNFAVDQTDAHDASFNVVFVGFIVIVGAGGYGD